MVTLEVECDSCNGKTTIRVDEDCINYESSEEKQMGTETMYSVSVERQCKCCGVKWSQIHMFKYQGTQTTIGYK